MKVRGKWVRSKVKEVSKWQWQQWVGGVDMYMTRRKGGSPWANPDTPSDPSWLPWVMLNQQTTVHSIHLMTNTCVGEVKNDCESKNECLLEWLSAKESEGCQKNCWWLQVKWVQVKWLQVSWLPNIRWRMGREKRMGTSENVSTPPATTMSAWPDMIFSAPAVIAWLAEMHAMEMVLDGTEIGMPAPIAASRAMLEVLASWMTVP